MGFISFSVLVIIICFYTFWYGNTKALRLKFELQEKKNKSLPSLPIYYGKFSLISFLIPIFFLTLSWVLIKPIFLNHILHNYFLENVPSNFNGNVLQHRWQLRNEPEFTSSLVKIWRISENNQVKTVDSADFVCVSLDVVFWQTTIFWKVLGN